jgi:hypothetical protein
LPEFAVAEDVAQAVERCWVGGGQRDTR